MGPSAPARPISRSRWAGIACMRAIPVRFFTATGLLMRLRRAKREDRLDTELRQIAKARLLIIDEFGYMPVDEEGSRLLFQVISDSYETRSVIYTTNIEFSGWGARARRQEHGRRVDRPHRAPRKARQIRGRLLPQRARPHDQITKEKGAAGSDGAVPAGNQPPMLPKNSAYTVDANLQKHSQRLFAGQRRRGGVLRAYEDEVRLSRALGGAYP